MSPKEKNRNCRYLRIQEMFKYLSKEKRLALDFCYQIISDFFATEEQTVVRALKADIVADTAFKHFDNDRKWVDEYVRKATTKQEKRKDEKGVKDLFNELS